MSAKKLTFLFLIVLSFQLFAEDDSSMSHYVFYSSKKEIQKETELMDVTCEIVRRRVVTSKKGNKIVRIRKLNTYEYIERLLDLETYTTVVFMPKVHDYTKYEKPYNFKYCFFREKDKSKEAHKVVFYYPGLTSGPYSFFEIKGFRDLRYKFRDEGQGVPIFLSYSLSPLLSYVEEGVYPLIEQEVVPYLMKSIDGISKKKKKKMEKIVIGASLGGGNALHHFLKNPSYFNKVLVLGGNVVDFNLFDKTPEQSKNTSESIISYLLSWPKWFLDQTVDVFNSLFPFGTIHTPFIDSDREKAYLDYVDNSNASPFWVKLALWNARRRMANEEVVKANDPFKLLRELNIEGNEAKLLFSVGKDDELGFQSGMKKFCDEATQSGLNCEFDLINSFKHKYDFWKDPLYYPILRMNGHLILNIDKIFNFIIDK